MVVVLHSFDLNKNFSTEVWVTLSKVVILIYSKNFYKMFTGKMFNFYKRGEDKDQILKNNKKLNSSRKRRI